MLVNVFFNDSETDADIIEIPSDIVSNLNSALGLFWSWLFDKANDHSFWIIENGNKSYCSYRSDAFVFWINNYWLINNSESARIVELNAKKIDYNLNKIVM